MEGAVGRGLERSLIIQGAGKHRQPSAQQVVMWGFRTETSPRGAGIKGSSKASYGLKTKSG